MYTCGIDIGSVSTEALILDIDDKKNYKILSYTVNKTGSDSKTAAEDTFNIALQKAKLNKNEINSIVATGYGRVNVAFAKKNITEITCHASGVTLLFPDVITIIDIGGQDSKVIKIDKVSKKPIDFLMNDKCAAGTGRFLEVMAKTLEIDLENFGEIFLNTKNKVDITSTCTVFAESEIVSLIGHGVAKEKIIKGLIYSIADRIISMVSRVGLEAPVCLTGGVAKNSGISNAIEEKLGVKLKIPFEPQITGALGAAYLASNY
ncbi:MAG: acyl-CoA dehydratase activase [Actinobacteria bacterium]|nr:acyl-CoA dehydratase activase [Cyanobacteriota bacterium]MCL5771229.1 acyl-CoA dehydratase activase [Actinomycetota bacterium]